MQFRFFAGLTLLLVSIAMFIACNKSSDTVTSPAQLTVASSEQKIDPTAAATFGKVYLLTDEDYNLVVASAGGTPPGYQQLYLCDTSTIYTVKQIELGITDAFSGTWLPYAFAKDGHSHIFVKVTSGCNKNVANSISKYKSIIVANSPYTLQSDPHTIGSASISIIFTQKLK